MVRIEAGRKVEVLLLKDASKKFQILDDEIVHASFFKLRRLRVKHTLFAGGWSPVLDRELFQRSHCVAVLPYDPIADSVVLVEQFRIGAIPDKETPWLLEIVAGCIEQGENPEQVAVRESMEEAGCELTALIKVHEFYTSPGGSAEKLNLFCGRIDSTKVGTICGLESENEDIRVHVVKFDTAMAKVQNGEIDSAIPIVALQWLALNRERIRQDWA